MPSVTFRLSADLHERFLALCERRDVKPSEMIRQAVETLVDRVADAAARPIMPERSGGRRRSMATLENTGEVFRASSLLQVGPTTSAPGSRLKK